MLLNPGETIDFDGRRITYPDIRLIYWAGGNPFHHHQDLNRLLLAWRKPETIIVHEPWWTPLARYADIVLPATTTFERNDIGGASRDSFILAMQKAIEPVGEARDDYRIFLDLAERFGLADGFTEGRSEMEWLRHFYAGDREQARRLNIDLPEFEQFWEAGHVELPAPDQPIVLCEDFRRAPDLYPLPTPSGKIEIFSNKVASYGYADCPPHPCWLEPAEWLGSEKANTYPLHLLSNQPAHTAKRPLIRQAKLRWHIEHGYRQVKTGLGLHHFEGKTIAVIGTGSSSVQIVPALQPEVAHMKVFLGSSTWLSLPFGATALDDLHLHGGAGLRRERARGAGGVSRLAAACARARPAAAPGHPAGRPLRRLRLR